MMWLVVVNPTSGKRKGSKDAQDLVSLLKSNNIDFQLINYRDLQQTKDFLQQAILTKKFDRVVAVGGDGLINLCVQYLAQSNISLAVIPAGTGNDFSRAVGFHGKTVSQIFEILNQQSPRKIDLGSVNGSNSSRWYVQVLSTGFDAKVNALANRITWLRGKSKYTIAMILILSKFNALAYEIEIDGRTYSRKAMLLSVANGETYGGGMRICPGASNSDGVLDILVVSPVSKFVLLTIFPKVFTGKHILHPKVDLLHGSVIKISAPGSAYADGEYIAELPIEITSVKGALSTWVAV